MPPTRRDFIRYVGLFLASAIARGCGATPQVTCYKVVTIGPPPPTQLPNTRWATVRDCWYSLDDPRVQSFEDNDYIVALRQQHQETLQALVGLGEVDAAVAREINAAFDQAIAHIQRGMATCYIALPPEYQPRADLLSQEALLEEMAVKSEIDPVTVEQARAALARDIEWLSQFQAGQVPGSLEEIEADPNAVEAARILVELLLGR